MSADAYAEARSALAFVPAFDRETWLRIGMAVKSEFSDEGFALWSEWSQSDESYNERDARTVWRSISPAGGVTIKTLYREAIDRGWKPQESNGKTNGHGHSMPRPLPEQVRARLEVEDAERSERQREAAVRAVEFWSAAQPAPADHSYLVRKGVKPHGLRVYSGRLIISEVNCDGALIAPLRDSAGELHNLQFITADSEKRYLPGGRISSCYHAIGKPDGVLVIAEGYATAASLHEATGHATACAFNAGNLVPVAKALRAKLPGIRIIAAADNDIGEKGNVGVKKAQEAARAVNGLVAVPEIDGRKCDFNDMVQALGAEAVRSAIEGATPPSEDFVSFDSQGGSTLQATWADPRPLEDALPPVEAFTTELLPDALRPWIEDVAERTQAPVEYVAVSAMVSLGAALGRKLAVRPKRLDDWCEFANLWGAVIGPPSWMKSPALDEGTRPLTVIETRGLEGYELTHREWEADAEAAKVKRDGARDRARKAASKGEDFNKSTLVAEPIPDEPKPPRLIVNNATVPALCDVLRANENGVLVLRDELAGLIAELDHEGMEGSRSFYLTAWSGKQGYTEDRIGRGTNLRVPHVCLSLLGGIQPARVAPLLKESIATGGADGFLARFSLAVWPDCPGEYKAIDREPDEAARRAAQTVYERLHALTPESVEAECIDGTAPFLRLDPAAAEAFTAWDVELRNRLRFGGDDGALGAHLGKYPKTVCGIALLTHLADGGTGDINKAAIQRALAWSELLESHARRLYASLGQAHVEAARSLLGRIKRGDLPIPFKVREIHRRGWAHLSDAEAARAATDVLEAKGYIRSRVIEPGQFGGRPTVEYHAHPSILSQPVQL